MAGHLRRIDKGDRSLVALPVFPLRNFTARDLYVRKDGPVKTPGDLRASVSACTTGWPAARSGTAISCASSACRRSNCDGASAPSMSRASPTMSIRCRMACTPRRRGGRFRRCSSPANSTRSTARRGRGRYHPVDGPIVRLFPDIRAIERDYFRQTRTVPAATPRGAAARDVWQRNKWVAVR